MPSSSVGAVGSDLDLRRARYEQEGLDTERYASDSFWDRRYHVTRSNHIRRLLAGLSTSGDIFLDVGAGTGEYIGFMNEEHGSESVGIDLSLSYCNRIRGEGRRALVAQASATALPFSSGSIDLALCSEVVEHVPPVEARQILVELCRVTRRTVVVTTPNEGATIRRLGRSVAPGSVASLDGEVGHINLMTEGQFRDLLTMPGWDLDLLDLRHIMPPVLGERLHLPVVLSQSVGAVERLASRLLAAGGNAMFAVLSRTEAGA